MKKKTIISIGEILFDIFPGYKRIGGAPFNFAYHLQKLGMPVNLITKIGEDIQGRDIMNILELNGFDTRHIQQSSNIKTGKVLVSLDNEGNPIFDILTDTAYDCIEFDDSVAATLQQSPDLIYFGTLSQRTEKGHEAIQGILSAREPDTRSLYDINLRPNCYTEKIIRASLRQCDVLKINIDELHIIKSILGLSSSINACIAYLMKHYGIDVIALTKSKDGSELFTATGSYQLNIDPIDLDGDTVGAGDAFAAVLAVGYLNQWHPEDILRKASDLAARVCSIKGAIPKSAAFYNGIIMSEKG